MLPVACIVLVLLIAMGPIASFAGEAHKSDWGYSGATGPNHWGDNRSLKPANWDWRSLLWILLRPKR